jgi:hypothetical protein
MRGIPGRHCSGLIAWRSAKQPRRPCRPGPKVRPTGRDAWLEARAPEGVLVQPCGQPAFADELREDLLAGGPGAKSRCHIDVATGARIDQARPPCLRKEASPFNRHIGVVHARHDHRSEWQPAKWHRGKSPHLRRDPVLTIDVRRRDQQGSTDLQIGMLAGQMGNQRATETVPDHDSLRRALDRLSEPIHPKRADGSVPIRLRHSPGIGIRPLPVRLPMARARASKPGNYQNLHCRAHPPLGFAHRWRHAQWSARVY